ncbi:MAG: hypothetical protein MUF18_09860 [Fimbriiglobus sp.]|jgi:outer membrane biosynthesis protein TonB|nr:hypothetical protein [Fimbriiglobus sp.]
MIRLTLRTLLAYLDDTLPPADARVIGQKLAENEETRQLVDRIRVLVRKRSLSTPTNGVEGSHTDPNIVAAYLSDALPAEMVERFEQLSLDSDASLAELAACHQILTLVLSDQVRVPPSAYKKMYKLAKGKESIPTRSPGREAVPVGGVNPADEKTGEADDADAAYLLGLPAYSRNEPAGRKMLRWAGAGLLACGFVTAAGLAWWSLPSRPTDHSVAALPTDKKDAPVATTPSTEPKKEEPKKEEPKKEEVKPAEPKKEEVKPAEPMEPKKEEPKKEEPAGRQPPNPIRGAIGVNDGTDEQVMVVRKSTAEGWERVKKGAQLQTTDRLVCLPGYRAKVQFKGGVAAELWANVPGELLPMPVAETAITPHFAPDGIDADLTLHVGRIYLNNTLDRAAIVRVRVRDPKFPAKDIQLDLTLPDKGCEVVVEVGHQLKPGAVGDPPRTITVVHALKGTPSVPLQGKPTTLTAGDVVVFDSIKDQPEGPIKPDEKTGKGVAYFDREPVYENADKSRATLKAMRQAAERLKDAAAVPAAVAELRTDGNIPPAELPVFVAGAVWSVFATAALGDVGELADLLNDPNRQGIRATAFAALRGLLAASPDKFDTLRRVTKDRWKLSDADADRFLDTVAGLDPSKRKNADVLNKLAEQLTAETVAQREAALFVLLTEVDPMAQAQRVLAIDVAGPADLRTAAVAGWKKRIADLVK